ncbi:MAG TPA: ATP-dependent helicase C-terminal domain-containing protein [Thermoanaerobaculia bacterium]|nr:ATP-dependent helicase C-terminal domain-containing protein [Thermoanaerobaculia bacterium]
MPGPRPLPPPPPGRAALSIDDLLPAIQAALRAGTGLVVAAPPGTGKTTRVAPAIAELDEVAGRVVLLEPRRLAAISAARRIAEERAEQLGAGRRAVLGVEIGYQVRFERRWSHQTRLVAATEGTLVRWLLEDPLLEGVGCIVFDEVHERNLSTDLALAMALRLREVRDDLRLVAMSATLDAERFAGLLGPVSGSPVSGCPVSGSPVSGSPVSGSPVSGCASKAAPVVRCEVGAHPVEVRYARRPDDRPIERRTVVAIRGLLRELEEREAEVGAEGGGEGGSAIEHSRTLRSVLAFLPGVGEIERCRELLAGDGAAALDVPVLPLHGSLDLDRQQAALRGGRRVVLATNVAESSVTVEGVGAVVDSGLERILRLDPASGLDRLELAAISRASADQRAGRAGRTGPGICVRLWTESEQGARVAERQPEIQRVDVASPVLAARAWGEDPATLRWPDPPAASQLVQAEALLRDLGALDAAGSITARGRRMAVLPLHPRLGALVLSAAERDRAAEGALIAALIGERDPFRRSAREEAETLSDLRSDVLERWLALVDALRGARDPRIRRGAAHSVLRAARQIASAVGAPDWRVDDLSRDPHTQEILLRSLLAAYPDRVARRREPRAPRAVMTGGHGVRLSPASRVRAEPLFVCVLVGGSTGGASGGGGRETVVHSASAVEEAWLDTRTEETAELDEQSGRVTLRRRRHYRDLVLDDVETGLAPADRAAALLLRRASRDPITVLALDRSEVERFLARVACLRAWRPELDLPDFDLPSLDRLGPQRNADEGRGSECAAPQGAASSDADPAGGADPEAAEVGSGPSAADSADADPGLDELPPVWRAILEAAVAGARTTAEVARAPVLDLLRGALSWEQQRRLDELAPERLTLPSGRRAEVRYERGKHPVLAARIQDFFGWRETPPIAGGRVPLLLHLLAPNLRVQQVTDDLAGFWRRTYPEVRRELAGRYPKHQWPEDGATAEPVKGPARRRRRQER